MKEVRRLNNSLKERVFNGFLHLSTTCSVKSLILSDIPDDGLESAVQAEVEKIASELKYRHDIVFYDSDIAMIRKENGLGVYAVAIQLYQNE